jgi:hypothetical protein
VNRSRSERGAVAGSETWVLGVLVFVVGTLLVAWAWVAVQARSAADSIAREYLRAFTEAPDVDTALAEGRAAAWTAATERGVVPGRVRIDEPTELRRCTVVSVTVHVDVPGLRLGPIRDLTAIRARTTRSEMTDPYRQLSSEEADDAPTLCD